MARPSQSQETDSKPERLPPVGRRERNKQEKRARIVNAARRLFAEKGFENTTTLEIAADADIGTGTLFLYARSKEDLLVMVFRDEMIEQAQAAFASLRSQDGLLEQLMHVFTAMLGYHERDRELAKILLREIMFPVRDDHSGEISVLMDVVYTGLSAILVSAMDSGRLRTDFDARLVAEGFFSAYYMILLEWLSGRKTSTQALDRLRQHLALALSGLA